MRKQAKRKQRRTDPMAVYRVLNRIEPLRPDETVQLTAPVRVAFEKFKAGTAAKDDFNTLAAVCNMCMVIAESVSTELVALCQRAQDDLMAVAERYKRTGRWGLDHASLGSMPDIIDVYEQLLEVCTPMQMKAAGKEVVGRIDAGNTLKASHDI